MWTVLHLFSSIFQYIRNIHTPREQEAVYHTCPQSLQLRFLIHWLNNFRDFYWILIGWFIKLSVQSFQPLIVIYGRGNFVYHHWECTSIYVVRGGRGVANPSDWMRVICKVMFLRYSRIAYFLEKSYDKRRVENFILN